LLYGVISRAVESIGHSNARIRRRWKRGDARKICPSLADTLQSIEIAFESQVSRSQVKVWQSKIYRAGESSNLSWIAFQSRVRLQRGEICQITTVFTLLLLSFFSFLFLFWKHQSCDQFSYLLSNTFRHWHNPSKTSSVHPL